MSGPFKLKYKNSSFPFKEQESNVIVDAAGSAYAIPEGTSITAGFMEGVATGLSTKKTKDKKKGKDKEESKIEKWWKKAIGEKRASHAAWRASRKGK